MCLEAYIESSTDVFKHYVKTEQASTGKQPAEGGTSTPTQEKLLAALPSPLA